MSALTSTNKFLTIDTIFDSKFKVGDPEPSSVQNTNTFFWSTNENSFKH